MVAIIKRAISALNLRLNMALSFKTIYLLLLEKSEYAVTVV